MSWSEWADAVEIEPSIYASDFSRLGAQLETLHGAGARVFHFDVGDGHFIPEITIGPDRARVHLAVRARLGCEARLPSDGRGAGAALRGDRARGWRQRHVPRRGVRRPSARRGRRAFTRARRRRGVQPRDSRGRRRGRLRRSGPRALHVDSSGLLGPGVHAGALGRIAELRAALPLEVRVQVDGGINRQTVRAARDAGADLLVAGSAVFWSDDPGAAFGDLVEVARA